MFKKEEPVACLFRQVTGSLIYIKIASKFNSD